MKLRSYSHIKGFRLHPRFPCRTIPITLLREKGVKVSLGDDSITDHWSPFGKGDSLEKAGTLAERFGLSDERSLGQTLGFITGGVTPFK